MTKPRPTSPPRLGFRPGASARARFPVPAFAGSAHHPDRFLAACSSSSFFFVLAFLFWNQLYTFASLTGPSLASSSVIFVRRSPFGVPMPVAKSSASRASCAADGVQRAPLGPSPPLE